MTSHRTRPCFGSISTRFDDNPTESGAAIPAGNYWEPKMSIIDKQHDHCNDDRLISATLPRCLQNNFRCLLAAASSQSADALQCHVTFRRSSLQASWRLADSERRLDYCNARSAVRIWRVVTSLWRPLYPRPLLIRWPRRCCALASHLEYRRHIWAPR